MSGQLTWMCRRSMCTGESMNMVRRLKIVPTEPLIPAAAGAEQSYLEASLLSGWVTDREPARHGWPFSSVTAVYPATDLLAISLSATASLVPLLGRVLPHATESRPAGVPRLDVHPQRDSLDLRLLGPGNETVARVRFSGVSRQSGREVLTRLGDRWQASLDEAEPTHERLPTKVDAVLSGLLRRFALWRDATGVSINLGLDTVSVRWRGNPDGNAVAAVLTHSRCRLPRARIVAATVGDTHQIDISLANESHHHDDEPWIAWIVLHTAQRLGRGQDEVTRQSPSVVRPEVWEDPAMRNALAARDVSAVYKLLRRTGVSQRQLAAMTGQSQSEVSEILKGRQVMAYEVLVRIADGLGVPRGYMGLAYDEVTAVRVAGVADVDDAENVKRRKFLAHAAAVAVGAHVLGPDSGSWESIPAPPPDRVGMAEVRQVEAATRALRSLDHQYGGGFCRDAVAAQALWAEKLMAEAMDETVRARLERAVADLERLATASEPDDWTRFFEETGE